MPGWLWASVGGAVLMGLAVGMAGGGSVGASVGMGCIAATKRRHPINKNASENNANTTHERLNPEMKERRSMMVGLCCAQSLNASLTMAV